MRTCFHEEAAEEVEKVPAGQGAHEDEPKEVESQPGGQRSQLANTFTPPFTVAPFTVALFTPPFTVAPFTVAPFIVAPFTPLFTPAIRPEPFSPA